MDKQDAQTELLATIVDKLNQLLGKLDDIGQHGIDISAKLDTIIGYQQVTADNIETIIEKLDQLLAQCADNTCCEDIKNKLDIIIGKLENNEGIDDDIMDDIFGP